MARSRSALRRFLCFSEAAARATGLTPQQHQALLALLALRGCTAGAMRWASSRSSSRCVRTARSASSTDW
ncbi:MAG: hypothetical protein ABI689_05830 [Thermoanaerobaculia bacterium]